MRISDWSSDVCSSDLTDLERDSPLPEHRAISGQQRRARVIDVRGLGGDAVDFEDAQVAAGAERGRRWTAQIEATEVEAGNSLENAADRAAQLGAWWGGSVGVQQSGRATGRGGVGRAWGLWEVPAR